MQLTLITVVIAVVAVMATGYAYFRSSAVKVWEQNSAAYAARVKLLEEQNVRLEETVTRLEARIKELEARPDWDKVVAIIGMAEHNILSEIRGTVVRDLRQMLDEKLAEFRGVNNPSG